ncbi:MAG TPA: hypothetical protein VM261_08705 [Kofleriaceae bacterium]|nr:hypothetical protein [Kofleriaceae bacterium]
MRVVRVILGLGAAAVAAVVAWAGCYKPPANECVYECTAAGGCPAKLECHGGFCVEPGSTTVCGGGDDADPDSVDDDGGTPDGTDNPDGPQPTRRYRALAVGYHHACAIDTGGQLWCWGANDQRQLGTTTADDFAAQPLHILPTMTNGEWTAVAAGGAHTCALFTPTAGAVQLWCWGGNFSYQTGNTASSPTAAHPVSAPAGTVWKRLALGAQHTCAVVEATADQTESVRCWGDNAARQLGSAVSGMTATPTAIDGGFPATTRFRSLTAGSDHTCVIGAGDHAVCWGDNTQFECGAASGTTRVPFELPGTIAYSALVAGDSFTCGIELTSSTLRCWGRNGASELGIGPAANTVTPTAVLDQGMNAKWKALALGQYGACGIQGAAGSTDAIGAARCWGANDYGERGDGTFELATSGPEAMAVGGVFAIGAGHLFACALAGDPASGGTLYCWGDNADGQIGIGFPSDQRRPVRVGEGVRGTNNWLAVAAGRRHTCAILSGASVDQQQLYCWGAGMSGELDGTPVALPRRAPVRVSHADGATNVVVGSSHTCVRRTVLGVPQVNCWGSDQGYQLGVAGNQSPGPVTTYDSGSGVLVNTIVGAGNVTCAIGSPAAQCWGSPELTNPYYVDNELPQTISLNAGAMPNGSFSAGPSSGCWIDGAQTLCFGTNVNGQLGMGSAGTPTVHPQAVFQLSGATSLSRGPSNHRCAVTANRVVQCWGANGYNQAGVNDGTDKFGPSPVQAPNQYDSVATGLNHTCALNGTQIYCWGNNDQYQRSAIASTNSLPPASIVAPVGESMPAWSQLVTGEYHTCAISMAGVLYCWGASRWGQVGIGAASEAVAVPVIDGTL